MDGKEIDEMMSQAESEIEQARQVAMKLLPEEAKKTVEEAKRQNVDVYVIQVGEKFYVFRSLGRFEYQNLLIDQSRQAEQVMKEAPNQISGRVLVEMRNQNQVVSKATLWPKMDDLYVKTVGAGVVETLHNSIMIASGFGQDPVPIKL